MPNSKAVFPKSGLALIALLVAASAALGVVHFVRSSAKRSVNSTATPVLTATQGRPHSNMEAELITVTPNGFEPLEINRPKGSFLLMVQNRSGLPDVAIQLNREAGPNLQALQLPREQPNWDDVIDLEPGRYVLTEADHPGWSCRITITAQ
jgi:hypothetical protein